MVGLLWICPYCCTISSVVACTHCAACEWSGIVARKGQPQWRNLSRWPLRLLVCSFICGSILGIHSHSGSEATCLDFGLLKISRLSGIAAADDCNNDEMLMMVMMMVMMTKWCCFLTAVAVAVAAALVVVVVVVLRLLLLLPTVFVIPCHSWRASTTKKVSVFIFAFISSPLASIMYRV